MSEGCERMRKQSNGHFSTCLFLNHLTHCASFLWDSPSKAIAVRLRNRKAEEKKPRFIFTTEEAKEGRRMAMSVTRALVSLLIALRLF